MLFTVSDHACFTCIVGGRGDDRQATGTSVLVPKVGERWSIKRWECRTVRTASEMRTRLCTGKRRSTAVIALLTLISSSQLH